MNIRIHIDDFYDTMAKARGEYCHYDRNTHEERVVDQSDTMRRAEELAKTPFEHAYAASANDVLRRIQSCRGGLPENKDNMTLPVGRWNFFDFVSLYKDNGKTWINRDFRRSFEWKSNLEGAGEALLMNGIFELLSNADNECVWDTEWETPGTRTREYLHWGDLAHATITTEDIGVHPEIEGSLQLFEISLGKSGQLQVKSVTDSLENLLRLELSLPAVELIRCGGEDLMAAQREQWNDGSNTLCIAPGKVITYERNYVTNQLLDKKGLTVLTIPSSELSRGRGGPRCMSCPVNREDL